MVLASCNSAVGQVRASNDVTGLAAALLTAGAWSVIGAVVPLPDLEVVETMVRLHAGLAAGVGPAAALSDATAREDIDDPLDLLAAAAFVCYGAG